MRQIKLWALALTIGISGLAYGQQTKLTMLKNPIPLPNLTYSNGKTPSDLKIYRGKYVLLNFWATWCSPCVSEMPSLDKMASKTKKDNLIVVAISEDEGGYVESQPFIKKLGLNNLVLLYDTKKKAFKDLGLKGLPTTFLVNPQGEIIATIEGAANWHDGPLFEEIMTLVKK